MTPEEQIANSELIAEALAGGFEGQKIELTVHINGKPFMIRWNFSGDREKDHKHAMNRIKDFYP